MDRSSNDKIYVYVEEHVRQRNSLIIDFDQSFDFSRLLPTLGFDDLDYLTNPSMIEVHNYLPENYERTRITEGTTYELNIQAIELIVERSQLNVINNSYVIGFEVDMNDIPVDLFKGTKSSSLRLNDRIMDNSGQVEGEIRSLPKRISGLGTENYVIVRKVGQGNWNELICDEKAILYYDIGAPVRASKDLVQEILSSRIPVINNDNPNLVISHWDLDHYHCLFGLDDQSLRSFASILVRQDRPNMTARRIQGRIQRLMADKYFPIPADPRPRPKSRRPVIPLRLIKDISNDRIKIFNAEFCRDRNKSGIVVLIQSEKSSVVLAADHHYNQINSFLLPEMIKKGNHSLIVPHHGGRAGKFIYELSGDQKPKKAIISVGKNNYNHPLESIKEKLREMRFKVEQTNIIGSDIRIKL